MRSAEPKIKPESAAGVLPPQTLRRRIRASAAVLLAQEAAAQVRNTANAALRSAHDERTKLPSKIELKKLLKHAPSALALGRAKQVQYAVDDAAAMFASYRSNFFAWVKDHASRPGQPARAPGWVRRSCAWKTLFPHRRTPVRTSACWELPVGNRRATVLAISGEGVVGGRWSLSTSTIVFCNSTVLCYYKIH